MKLWICLLLVALFQCAFGQDYYAILGLSKDSSEKEIKSAYRQLSKKYHPDKNPGDEDAHHKFIEVGEAYDILGDPEKRQKYDQFGADAFKNGGQGGPGGGGFHDPFDLFNQMFGQQGGFGGQHRPRGQNYKVQNHISLKEFYNGGVINFQMPLNEICDKCSGSGSADGKVDKCSTCQGRGIVVQMIRMGMMTQQIQQQCPHCGGKGHVIKNPCKQCKGSKVVRKEKKFEFKFDAGIPRNHMDVKQGESDKSPDLEAGDLILEFREHEQENLGYRRRGKDLYRTEVLTAKEAINGGWTRELEFLDDKKKVKISRKKGTMVFNGDIEKVKGFGMPLYQSKGFGDLYIDYVVLPESKSSIDDEL
ncbi:Scj1p [Nakaseomyces bracarensis]|uniref:Scj1p n=1 Tax=Nakaseomyces bracarensis TaxID=273131 RepID=UPI0038727BC7